MTDHGSLQPQEGASVPSVQEDKPAGHTKAPWAAEYYPAGDCWHITYDQNGCWLADVHIDGLCESAARADALLIAAAPDLLAALIDARSQLEVYERDATGETYNDREINAAISHALGEQA